MTARINSISADVNRYPTSWISNPSNSIHGHTVPNDPGRCNVGLSLLQILFLISVVLAPLDIKILASFTIYDLMVIVIAGLLIASERKALEMSPVAFMAAIYVFLLFALISAFRATYPLEALTQTLQFCFIFFVQLPVTLSIVKSPSLLRRSLLLLAVGILIVTGWAMIFQEEGGHHRLRTYNSNNSNRLGYPAAYMLPFLICLLSGYWRRKSFLLVGFIIFLFYTMLWALSASGSRSAAAGTVVSLMIFLTFRKGINLKALLRACGAVITVGVSGYLFYQSSYSGVLRERIERTLQADDTLIGDRVRLAKAAWRSFQDSPLVGVGLDNFQYVSQRFDVPSVTAQAPHNLWLQFLAQVGLIGTLAFLALILCWFFWLYWAQRICIDQSKRDILWAFMTSMTALMTIFMFAPIMIERLYWLIYALGLAAVVSVRERQVIRILDGPITTQPFYK